MKRKPWQRFTKWERRYYLRKFNHVCQICLKNVFSRGCGGPSLDHKTALADGGLHIEANIQLTCLRCNCVKSNRWDDGEYSNGNGKHSPEQVQLEFYFVTNKLATEVTAPEKPAAEEHRLPPARCTPGNGFPGQSRRGKGRALEYARKCAAH